jgi:tetratricopeptide (TPR) repeat protein
MYYYQEKGDEYKALICAFNVLKLKDFFSDKEGIGRSYLDIGTHYYSVGNTQKSIDYFLKAYGVLKNYETTDILTTLLNNLGVVYGANKEYKTSIKFQKESILRCTEIGHDFGKGMSLNNIGGIYYQLDSFELGYSNLTQAIIEFTEPLDYSWRALSYCKLARGQLKQDSLFTAESNGLKAMKDAEISKNKGTIIRVSKLLTDIYEAKGDVGNELFYFKKNFYLNDTLKQIVDKNELKKIEKKLEFESEQKDRKLEHLNWKSLQTEQGKEDQSLLFIIWSLVVLVLFLFLFLVYKVFVAFKQKKVIEVQNAERKVVLKENHHRVKNNFQKIRRINRLKA